VFGASEDKDIEGMYQELLPKVNRVIATQSTHPRAMEADTLLDLAHRFGCSAEVILPIEKAIARAIDEAGQESVVLVTGSVFVAAAAREVLSRLKNEETL